MFFLSTDYQVLITVLGIALIGKGRYAISASILTAAWKGMGSTTMTSTSAEIDIN